MGGAISSLSSQTQIRKAFQEFIKDKKIPLEFQSESINMSLSNGIWPRFGVEFKKIDISSTEECVGTTLHIPYAYLPVSIFSLLRQHFKLGTIDIQSSHLHWHPNRCQEEASPLKPTPQRERENIGQKNNTPGQEESPPSNKSHFHRDLSSQGLQKAMKRVQENIPQIQDFMRNQWVSDIQRLSQWVGGLHLKNTSISQGPHHKHVVTVQTIFTYLSSKDNKLVISAHLQPTQKNYKSWTFRTPLQVRLEIGPQSQQFFLTFQIKEGKVRLHARANTDNLHFDTEVDIRHLPLKEMVHLLGPYGGLSPEVQKMLMLKMFWLNCKAHWSGLLNHLERSQIQTKSCQFISNKGTISFPLLDIHPLKETFLKRTSIKIEKLSISKIVHSLTKTKATRALAHFGILNGEVNFLPSDGWKILLNFQDMTLPFSKRGKRIVQEISSLHLIGNYHKNEGLHLKVNDIQMKDGSFQGNIKIHSNKDSKEINFLAQIKHLDFAPSVKELMSIDSISPFELRLSHNIKQEKWGAWTGEIKASKIQGKQFLIKDFSIKGQFEKRIFIGTFNIDQVKFTSKHPYFPWITPLFLGQVHNTKSVSLKKFTASMAIQREGGAWKKASGHELHNTFAFQSEGFWKKKGAMQGRFLLKTSTRPPLMWDIGGSTHAPTLIPQAQVIEVLSKSSMSGDSVSKDPVSKDPVSPNMSPRERWQYVKDL